MIGETPCSLEERGKRNVEKGKSEESPLTIKEGPCLRKDQDVRK